MEVVDIHKTPFRFLDDTSDGLLFLPSDSFTPWFAQLLRKGYGIGDIAIGNRQYGTMRKHQTYKALWIICGAEQKKAALSKQPSKCGIV